MSSDQIMPMWAMRPSVLNPLFATQTTLPGVGPKVAEKLAHVVGGSRVKDLLFRPPHHVIDRSHRGQLMTTPPDTVGTFVVEVTDHLPPRGPRQPHKIIVQDDSGFAHLVFFHSAPNMAARYPVGRRYVVSGKIEVFNHERHIVHPDYLVPEARADEIPAHEAVYPLTQGLSGKVRRKATLAALGQVPQLPEWLDETTLRRGHWPAWHEALHSLHHPEHERDLAPTAPHLARLAYDELLAHQLTMALVRQHHTRAAGNSFKDKRELVSQITSVLPFALTESQKSAWLEIRGDLEDHHRMARLLQGDVGAGKTVVALLAMAQVASSGAQAALMAPTEVLARQHAATITTWAEAVGLGVVILTGRDKGKARAAKLEQIKNGADLVIGTHALFQHDVEFSKLGLVVVDEQHRFGVSERMALMDKGGKVDLLVMSATPIPRTLELSLYGDLDVSRISGKPPGRKPVDTRAVPNSRYDDLVARLKSAIADGAQAYWICPLVEESEHVDLAAAEDRYHDLQGKLGAEHVALVHGRMTGPEKDAALQSFQSGEKQVLVSTTVVEVGVDVPGATLMVIEHAERFGLAQLHQLRGRVGRSSAQAYCLLMYAPPLGQVARARLEILRSSNDGFRIAEEDWQLRGGGDPLGLRQSGLPDYHFVDIYAHRDLMRMAAEHARTIVNADPHLRQSQHSALQMLLYLFDHIHRTGWLAAG